MAVLKYFEGGRQSDVHKLERPYQVGGIFSNGIMTDLDSWVALGDGGDLDFF